MFNRYESILNTEIQEYNLLVTNQMKNQIDSVMQESSRFIQSMEYNDELKEIAALPENLDIQQLNRLTRFLQTGFRMYYIGWNSDFYLYFKKSGRTMWLSAAAEERNAFEVVEQDSQMDYEQWLTMVRGTYYYEANRKNEEEIRMVHTLFAGKEYETNVVMSFNAVQLVQLKNLGQRSIGIFKADGQMLYSSTEWIHVENIDNDFGMYSLSIDGNNYVLSYATTDMNKWKCVVLTPIDEFYKTTYEVRWIQLFSVILCGILGICAVLLLARYNYRPMRKLVEGLGGNRYSDEYTFIQRTIDHMNNDKGETMKRGFITKLLSGTVLAGQDMDRLIQEYQLLPAANTAAAVIDIQNAEGFLGEQQNEKNVSALYFAISNIYGEVAEGYECYSQIVECEGCIGVLMRFEQEETLQKMLCEIHEYLSNVLAVECRICCGAVRKNLGDVSGSYREARGVMEYMRFTGERGVGIYQNAEKNIYQSYEQSKERLIKAVGDPEALLKEMTVIFSTDIYKPAFSEIQVMLYEIGTVLLQNVDGDQKKSGIANVLDTTTFQEFFTVLISSMEAPASFSQPQKKENNTLVLQIKQYVQENYANRNLSNGMIAGALNMSEGYLSQYFKGQTGEGLLNYITKLRVEKSKELLLTTRRTINDIAQQVGFYNGLSLIRAYKKYEGITPTQYRNANVRKEMEQK